MVINEHCKRRKYTKFREVQRNIEYKKYTYPYYGYNVFIKIMS